MREKTPTIRYAGALAVLTCLPVVAQASEPLYVKNLSPIAGLIGLPSQSVLIQTLQR